MDTNIIELKVDATQTVAEQSQYADMALAMAQAYGEITSQSVCAVAAVELRQIVTKRKELNEARLRITRPMDEAKAAVMDLFRPALERLEQAETFLKGKVDGFLALEEQRRKEEEARQAELRRQEQERIAKEAAEARAKAEAEAAEKQRLADEALQAGNQEAAALALAAADEIRSEAAQAQEAAVMQAAVMPAPIVSDTKVKGISRSQKWKAELVSKLDLIKHVAAHPEYLHLLDVNMPAANALARAQRENLNVAGLKAVVDHTVSSRAA